MAGEVHTGHPCLYLLSSLKLAHSAFERVLGFGCLFSYTSFMNVFYPSLGAIQCNRALVLDSYFVLNYSFAIYCVCNLNYLTSIGINYLMCKVNVMIPFQGLLTQWYLCFFYSFYSLHTVLWKDCIQFIKPFLFVSIVFHVSMVYSLCCYACMIIKQYVIFHACLCGKAVLLP